MYSNNTMNKILCFLFGHIKPVGSAHGWDCICLRCGKILYK